jgi:hypothetical protein
LKVGDTVVVVIGRIGRLENPVRKEYISAAPKFAICISRFAISFPRPPVSAHVRSTCRTDFDL